MRQLLQCRAIRSVCYVLVMALVTMLVPAAKPANAQLMPQYSVAVVDFTNDTSVLGDTLARQATDAIVVEMSKTNRYDVSITRSMIKDAMEKLELHPPLDKVNVVRLGEELAADAVLEGAVKSVQLSGNGATRRASVTIVVQMVDQASGEVVNGAVQTGTSSARVGYTATDNDLIFEAASKAAFLAVKTMVDYVMPEATVQVNLGTDQVMLNRGVRDGMKPGMRMIVLRQKEIIGYCEVREVNPTDSVAKIVKSIRGIQPEDKCRAIFDLPAAAGAAIVKSGDELSGGAPPRQSLGHGPAGQIGKFLLVLALVAGVATLFAGGRGSESAPKIGTAGPMEITWNPTKYGHGVNVLEYQVLRDAFSDGAVPVKVLRDPTEIDLGRTSLANLYGTGADLTFNYYAMTTNPSDTYTSTSVTLPLLPYGETHQYQVRVLYKNTHNVGGSGSGTGTGTGTGTDTGTGTGTDTGNGTGNTTNPKIYYYTPVSSVITLTCIEPVGLSAGDINSPVYDPNVGPTDLYISELTNPAYDVFSWNAKKGADIYRIVVEPVEPGTAPTWQSSVVYATGPTVKLSQADRNRLASMLNNYPDKVMKWRVDCRHQADTGNAWVAGTENWFRVSDVPPPMP